METISAHPIDPGAGFYKYSLSLMPGDYKQSRYKNKPIQETLMVESQHPLKLSSPELLHRKITSILLFLLLFFQGIEGVAQRDSKPVIFFSHIGYEQQTYGFILGNFSYFVNNSGYTSTMHSIVFGYNPKKSLTQLAYEFDCSLMGIGLGIKTGSHFNRSNQNFFICPEIGLNLIVAKLYAGYYFPLFSTGSLEYKGLAVNLRIGIQLNNRDR